jgi:hypothetical protein
MRPNAPEKIFELIIRVTPGTALKVVANVGETGFGFRVG